MKFLLGVLAFPFYVGMIASSPLVYLGQLLASLVGCLGPLAMLSDPIMFVFMLPYSLFEWVYTLIHPSFH